MPYLVTATTQKPSAEVKLYNENNEAGLLGELFKKEIGMSKPSMTDDNTSDSDIAALNTPSNTNQNLASNSPKRTTPSSNNLDD